MRVVWAGLLSRKGLNAAALLVTVTALASSLAGVMYGRSSAEHLLDTRIAERAPYATGLTYALPAMPSTDLPTGSPERYAAPDPMKLADGAAASLERPDIDRFWQPTRRWLRDPGGTLHYGAAVYSTATYWREGMCDLAEVDGRCPTAPGEALVDATMARTLRLSPGDTVTLDHEESWLAHGPDGTVQRQRTVASDYTVVGTYRITRPTSPQWYDLSRFTGNGHLNSPEHAGATPAAPALLVAPASMTSQTFLGGADRPIDAGAVDLATMDAAQRAAQDFRTRLVDVTNADLLDDTDLGTLFDQVRAERVMLSRVTLAALAPLVVLALLLLHALVSSAAEARRPEVALAKLRGHTPAQVLRFAVSEPFLVVALALPLSVALAFAGIRLVARAWLAPGVPVALDAPAVATLAVVALAALVSAGVAAVAVLREPLSSALGAAVRAPRSSRWALVLRSAVVALAVGAVAQILAGGGASDSAAAGTGAGSGAGSGDGGQLLALLAPLFVALATAVAGVLLLNVAAGWWVRRTRRSAGTAAYLASRRLARRQDLARLMVPLLLAVSVITFAASASATGDDWRVSRARADVGAATTYAADTSPARLLAVTHRVDPDGRYLAAAVVQTANGDGLSRRVYVDTSRLASVAAWDPSWSDVALPRLAEQLAPRGQTPPVTLTGGHLSVRLSDVRLASGPGPVDDGLPQLWLRYADAAGRSHEAALGELPNARSLTLGVDVDCAQGCVVTQLFVSGSSQSVTDLQGSLTVAAVDVDGSPADWRLDRPDAWRPARPFPVSMVDPPVALDPGPSGLRLQVRLGELPAGPGGAPTMISGIARITPTDVPEVAPVVVTDGTATTRPPAPVSGAGLTYDDAVVGTALNGEPVPLRVVGRVRALPVLGDQGALSDLGADLREFEPPPGNVLDVELWAAEDTPPSMLAAVRDAGVPLTDARQIATELHALRSDAFTLGWRIFLLVGAVTLLLALFGVLASAVAQSRWRSYEVAALRVVGVGRRELVRASAWEYAAMLGFSVLLGVVSAIVSLVLVLPSVQLGEAGEFDPPVDYALHWPVVGAVTAVLFVLSTVIAVAVSRRVTRLGVPSTLRWAERA